MLEKQIDQAERRAVMRNEQRVREGRVFAPDQSLPREATTFHQFAQADAEIPRGRFTAHERSSVTGATPAPSYPPASAWCADPGSQLLEPPLGLENPAFDPGPEVSPARPLPNPAPADATSSSDDCDDERRDAGLGLSGDPAGVSFPSPPGTSSDVVAGSPPPLRRF